MSFVEEEEYDYESLGSNTTMTQNAFAGALAGIGEHCAMYPVDSIKVCQFFFRSFELLETNEKKFFSVDLMIRQECKSLIVPQRKQLPRL